MEGRDTQRMTVGLVILFFVILCIGAVSLVQEFFAPASAENVRP